MNEDQIRFSKIINNIEFKMIRIDDKFWIKVAPLVRVFIPSILQFILNDECYSWDIYDKNGIEAHEIFFEGSNCNPSFYLNSEEKIYRIDFNSGGIKVISLNDIHNKDDYIKEKCNCKSSNSSCWAKAVYYTSRPDKPPFDEM